MRSPILGLVSAAVAAGALSAQQSLHVFAGQVSADKFGYAVNTAGDLDRDGHDEIITSAVFADVTGSRSGTATVYNGLTGARMFEFHGNSVGDELGYSVGPAGDVNGDGQPDFVIGAIGGYQSRGPFNGAAFVYSGDTGVILHSFYGAGAYDYFGLSVRSAGDINVDGYDDVVIGAPGRDQNGSASGAVYVYSGRDGSLLHLLFGDGPNDQLGWWVDITGDLDGDGHPDIVAGAPRPNSFVPGYARVFSGRDGSVIRTIPGFTGGDYFGWCVGSAGDVDRDGVDDIVVGAHKDDANGADSGTVAAYSGRTGATLFTWTGDAAGDAFGWSCAGAGDVDGDGHADVIAGAHLANANGNDSGLARVFSGRTGLPLYTLAGLSADDQMGFAVETAGDVDDDGYADIVIGAIFDELGGTDAGALRVISIGSGGAPPRTLWTGSGCPGSDGRQPRIDVFGRGALGESYSVGLRGARAGAVAFLNIGVTFNLSLAPLAPGCVAYAYPLISEGATANAFGLASVVPSVCPLPVIPSLVGKQLTHQWLVLDAANNTLGVSASNAAKVRLGQ